MKNLFIVIGVTAGVILFLGLLIKMHNNNAPPAIILEDNQNEVSDSRMDELDGTSWVVSQVAGKDAGSFGITMTFSEGKVSGSDGCNRFSTAYSQTGYSITFSPEMMGTLMACEPGIMEMASLFRDNLSAVTSVNYSDSGKQLLDESGNVVIEMIPALTNLQNTKWELINYNNGKEAVVGLIEGTKGNLIFEDTKFSATAGCNQIFGEFSTSNGTLSFSQVGSSLMFCTEEGVMDQEAAIIQALNNSTNYQIEGTLLTTRDESGSMQLVAILVE